MGCYRLQSLTELRRHLLSLILICTILSLLPSQPVSSERTQTTMTSTQYSTATIATTVYSTIYSTTTSTSPIHFLQRPYDYNNRTGSFTLNQYEELSRPPPPNGIPIEMEHVCLYYDYFVFTAEASQEIKGHYEASKSVDFYVMTLSQLESFWNLLCGNNARSSSISVVASSFDLDWIAPNSGQYVFLFATHRSYGEYVTIYFSAYAYSTSVEKSTATNTLPSTSTTQIPVALVSTLTSTNTSTTSLGNRLLAPIAIILAVIALFVIIITWKRPRSAALGKEKITR